LLDLNAEDAGLGVVACPDREDGLSPAFRRLRSSFTSTPGTDPVREMFMGPGALLVMVTCPDSPACKVTDALSAFTSL
jgi:hypothetical protein